MEVPEEPVAPVVAELVEEESPGVTAVEPQCPKCTGPMLRCSVGSVGIYGWWLERVSRPAGALGPPRASTSEVSARTCVRCGYTEFYARDPASLLTGEDHN